MRWRTEKETSECVGSMSQIPATYSGIPAVVGLVVVGLVITMVNLQLV
jgi:hypothetical protein